jgi:glutamate synthase (NADPH/NADH) small chain
VILRADLIQAEGKHVVILGGGDTGADCLGTAHRQNALSTTMLAIGKQPPTERPSEQPWPMDPILFEVQSAHEEGGSREYLASTVEFLGNDAGEVRAVVVCETEYRDGGRFPKPGTEHGKFPQIWSCWRWAIGEPSIRPRSSKSDLGVD